MYETASATVLEHRIPRKLEQLSQRAAHLEQIPWLDLHPHRDFLLEVWKLREITLRR
jgi:hypothetical protein